ncbi:HAD-IIIA family hydrolase [Flexivirga sp. ID2601S]|uniref:HAD-IIIA family hydrolase n=1 Tax=Flexivirga aerilata TaxID=1656889 RepID=A0A849AM71_9MICO|nr:HAD-IIIA family hydrolase [Flexivirga aerilata]NNG40887.1 HAD-IIIA family hydrolase [Flexivirga aerilata]
MTQTLGVVIPTSDESSLRPLLTSLAGEPAARVAQVVIVDDRSNPLPDIAIPPELTSRTDVQVVRSWGRGLPAAANLGWRLCDTEWVVFLPTDARVTPDWAAGLTRELTAAGTRTGLSQGQGSADHAGHDADSPWRLADLAARKDALNDVGGFDERYRCGSRAAVDLALRMHREGWLLRQDARQLDHPVPQPDRPAGAIVQERCMSDDALLRHMHGRGWRRAIGAPRSRFPWYAGTTAAAVAANLAAAARGMGLPIPRRVPLVAAGAAVASTAALAAACVIRPESGGARSWRAAAASVVVPPVAVAQRLRGELRHRVAAAWPTEVLAVLFERDGTLIRDLPLNTDPDRVQPLPGARAAVDRLRRKGVRVGLMASETAVGAGDVSRSQMRAVNEQVDRLLGPFDTWQLCAHPPDVACSCRLPEPGMPRRAAGDLDVPVNALAVVGHLGADVTSALRAGARSVLVPDPSTTDADIAAAPRTAGDLGTAIDLILRGDVP